MASVDIEFGCKLHNLSMATTDDSLNHAFSQFGEIVKVKVAKGSGTRRTSVSGFVIYKELRSAIDAVDGMNGKELDGENITVELAFQTIPFGCGGIPLPFLRCGYSSVSLLFGYGCGASYGGSPCPNATGFCSDGYGWKSTETSEVGYGIIVGNLAQTTTNESLGHIFNEFGEIIQSQVSKDILTRTRNGLVIFKERKSVRAAINGMNGKKLDGETIFVKVAHASGPIVYSVGRCACGYAIARSGGCDGPTFRGGGDDAREGGSPLRKRTRLC